MALHLREQLMAAVTTNLTGLSTTGSNVTRGRVYSIDEDNLPHLSIFQGDDFPVVPDNEQEGTYLYLWQDLQVFIEVTVDASSGVLETTLNQIHKEITIALTADVTQGISECFNTIEMGATIPELSGERKKRTAIMELEFMLRYRRSRTDPSV